LVNSPHIFENPHLNKIFPEDAIRRALSYLSIIDGGTGSYSHSQGVQAIRKEVTEFIKNRDGLESNVDRIFLSDGASPSIQYVLRTLIGKPMDGVY
jgi:alanine transaminase